ncbi:MAG: single-stranded-DNA-specific exonuclease RecJ [Sphingomonadales bacterium]
MQKRWTIIPARSELANSLQEQLKIHPVLCSLLAQRGIHQFDEARSFFRPSLEELHSPWLMKDMKKATDRIERALLQQELVMIYGDYDVDGTTSVASLYLFLKKVHSPLSYYIPHRYREGYGISRAGIDHAAEQGVTLIISVDCGIKSVELIDYARLKGIDFIVCDHHLPDEQLPAAVAILNAKQKDCPYPYKELCGCGVAFKLMCALQEQLKMPVHAAYEYLDLLATAIAADIVPMTGENRILAYHGLQKANHQPNFGIAALASIGGVKLPFTIHQLVFMIAPRVNAAGRMDEGGKAVELFIAGSIEQALNFASQLQSDNSDRREADKITTLEALQLIEDNPEWKSSKSTVLFQPHWHKGVVGIVASRLIEHYHRPTIVLTQSGEQVAGSARSVPGFNLYEAIHACREHLIGYGGHFAAAGMTLQPDQVIPFREKFESVVAASILPEQLIPELLIDQELRLQDISPTFFSIISQMEPFGPENLRPVFLLKNVLDTGQSKIVKEEHVRFSLKDPYSRVTLTGISFGMASRFELLRTGQPIDVVCTLEENHYNNKTSLQLRVLDIRATPS